MLESQANWAREWLFDAALPFWWQVGADHEGGFHEKIALDGRPVPALRRIRVQTRQAYSFIEGGRLGWPGPWKDAAAHAVDFMRTRYCRADGLYRALVAPGGTPLDETADLYDQAFVLFALAHAHSAGIGGADVLSDGRSLLAALKAQQSHPVGGFEEASSRVLPLRSNPHMHLLESQLAWMAAGVREPFEAMAREIVELALNHLLDHETGAIGEYYDGDWRFAEGAAGRLREPGHQFEWAYLFLQAGRQLGLDRRAEATRLYAFGTRFGIEPVGRAVIFSVDAGGEPIETRARLWAQTERLRAALAFAAVERDGEERKVFEAHAKEAFDVLKSYLDVPVVGLWRDQKLPNGIFIEEASPASSFYHIVTAFATLMEAAGLVKAI